MKRILKIFAIFISLSVFLYANDGVTRITSDGKLILNYFTKIADFKDNVIVKTSDGGKLKSDKLTVFFDSKGDDIEKMIAIGHVFIDQQDHQAEGDRAEYYSKTGRLILSGNPVIKKGENYYSAEVITINTQTNKVYFEPSAQIVIHDFKNEE